MKSMKILAMSLLCVMTTTQAEMLPQVHQVDGYFLQTIGDLKVVALFDGEMGLPRNDLLRIGFVAQTYL